MESLIHWRFWRLRMGYRGTVFFLASVSQVFAISAVRGVFEKETHGAFLGVENCGVRGKYVLPGTTPSMLLAMPDEAIDQGARRSHFRMDPKSIHELDRLVDLSNRDQPVPKIVVNGKFLFSKNSWLNDDLTEGISDMRLARTDGIRPYLS